MSLPGTRQLTSWRSLPLDAATRGTFEELARQGPETERVVGRIDNDGRLHGLFGRIPGLPAIDEEEFVPRYRYPVDVVIRGDAILVRKDFDGREEALQRELCALRKLQGRANVPALARVDLDKCRLLKSYVYGRTLRDVLVEAGARILSIQTENDPELASLDTPARIWAVLARGSAHLASLPAGFLERLEDQVERIHAHRVVQLSLTFGNVMIDHENQAPWLIDFDNSRTYRSGWHPGFLLRRRRDRANFASIYRP